MVACSILAFTTLGLGVCMAYTYAQRKEIPYLVERNEMGVSEYVKTLDPADVHSPIVVANELERWIHSVRLVSSDQQETWDRMERGYYWCSAEAKQYIRNFYEGDRNLLKLYEEGITVYPQNIRVRLDSGTRYTARWEEELMLRGQVKEKQVWEATIYVDLELPRKEEERKMNALGIWISTKDGTALNWFRG